MESEIADLGNFDDKPSFQAAMRGYIALSRVTNADGVLIARPFPWKLFSQGTQPFPALLLETLETDTSMTKIMEKRNQVSKEAAEAQTRDVQCFS